MKRLLLLLLLLAPLALMAKTPVEEDIIEKTTSPDSPYYYPNLILRFNSGESGFTEEQMHYLYYGYAYQDSYRPLESRDEMDKALLLATAIDPYNPSDSAIDNIVIAANEALKFNPFSPNLWNLLAYAYGALGDKEREKMAYERMELIMKVIDNSGSGLKEREAKHIIMFDHALDLLTAQGIAYLDARVVSRTVEYIPFDESIREADSRKKIKGLYFDFGRVYWNKPDNVTYTRDRKWQFNGMKPKEYK